MAGALTPAALLDEAVDEADVRVLDDELPVDEVVDVEVEPEDVAEVIVAFEGSVVAMVPLEAAGTLLLMLLAADEVGATVAAMTVLLPASLVAVAMEAVLVPRQAV